jgi:hypothetical protein
MVLIAIEQDCIQHGHAGQFEPSIILSAASQCHGSRFCDGFRMTMERLKDREMSSWPFMIQETALSQNPFLPPAASRPVALLL